MHPNSQLTLRDPSCGRQLASLEGIPLDIAHHVSDYISVADLVALGAVSKSLRNLLSDSSIWKRLHRRAAFLLPPGPYDWQSTSYLVNALLRAEKLLSVWPSSSGCPEILRVRSMSFGCDTTLSVLLGRWLLVADGSMLLCHDSQCSDIYTSTKTLFDAGGSHRILRVFSVGDVRETGILALAVLLFSDSLIITKVLMDQGKPSEIQTIFTSKPIVIEGWTDLVHVRLYHRVLEVNIGECAAHWESCGGPFIMDTDTLRQYHIPTSVDDTAFDPMNTLMFFFATKTHLVRVREFSDRYKVQFQMECFPFSTAYKTPEGDVLHSSHRSRVTCGPKLRECVVIHESPIDSETGKMSFSLFGLNEFSDSSRMEVMEVCLESNGSISFTGFGFATYLVTSLCTGWSKQHGCGVALRTNKRLLVFALDYREPGSFVLRYSALDRRFPESELVALDGFRGSAFFCRRSSGATSIEVVDFTCDAQRVEGRQSGYALDRQMKVICGCGECYLSG